MPTCRLFFDEYRFLTTLNKTKIHSIVHQFLRSAVSFLSCNKKAESMRRALVGPSLKFERARI